MAGMNVLAAKPGERFIANWIKIANDDTVTVVIPHCDMGTGILTALAQMAGDELDADWSKVRSGTAPADPLFANSALAEGYVLDQRGISAESIPAFLQGTATSTFRLIAEYMDLQTTGGSTGVRLTGVYGMRVAEAAVREMLVKATAESMAARVQEFRTEMSRVIHVPSGRSFGYGELAAAAAKHSPSAHPKLKALNDLKLVRKPLSRLDVPGKVNGAARYGIDTMLPDMLYAAIRISPVFGGKLVSVNEAPVAHNRGISKVVKLDDAVIVVADRFWRARDAVARAVEAHVDDVTRLLPAQRPAARAELLEHVAIAHVGRRHRHSGLLHGGVKAVVGHYRDRDAVAAVRSRHRDGAIGNQLHDFFLASDGGDGKSTSKTFRNYGEVWRYAIVLLRTAQRHAKSGDDFVEDQHNSEFPCQPPQQFQITSFRQDAACVAHDGLGEHGGNVLSMLANRALQHFEVVPR